MAEKQQNSDPEKDKPENEIKEALNGVLGWVQQQKEKAEKKVAQNPGSKHWGWILGIIVAVSVFVALAIAAYSAWKKGKEVAKLKHQIDVDKEKREQAKADAAVAKNEDERKKLEKEVEVILERIESNDLKIDKLKEGRDKRLKEINEVTSWDDLDKIMR